MTWFATPHVDQEVAEAFATLKKVFALQGELVANDPESEVLRVQIGEQIFYVKRYFIGRRSLLRRWLGIRDWLGVQRAEQEWKNLQRFSDWGIPTAKLVAYGQERQWGRFVRAALITAELPETMDLAEMANNNDSRLHDTIWLGQVLPQVARATCIMHNHRFAHNDLKWRNILVNQSVPPQIFFIDCPLGSFWVQPFFNYRAVKDLACLDKVAKIILSRTWRLRFYLQYVQRNRLTSQDKKVLRKVIHFFDGRE